MPSEMYGMPIGEQAFAEMARTQAQTRLFDAQAEQQPALKRFHEAQATKWESENAQREKMATLMQQYMQGGTPGGAAPGPGGNVVSMADALDTMAQAAAGAGMVDEAGKIASQAALIRGRADQAAAARARQASSEALANQRRLQTMEGFLRGAVDERTWQQGNLAYEVSTGEPSPFMDMPYSPELVKRLTQSVISAKDENQQRITADEYASRDEHRRNVDAHNKAIEALRKRTAEVAERREARLAKAGGKPVTSPTKGEIDNAMLMINKEFGDMAVEDIGLAAAQVASRARAIRRSNPAIDSTMALQMAYNESKEGGDFQEGAPRTIAGFEIPGTKTKPRFVGAGKTAATALTLPEDKRLTKGRYYLTKFGPALWDGQQFSVADPAEALDPDADPDEEDPDDEEE